MNDSSAPKSHGPFDLGETPIHLGTGSAEESPAVPLPEFGFDGPSFMSYVETHCKPGSPGRLIMIEPTPDSWPTWERHTEGDEIVIVLEGKGEFIQEVDGVETRMPISPGATFINPRNVWHTADVVEPMRAIYITPCPGTENKPR